VLDDIAFGPILEQPARKDAIPFVIALFLHGQLNKGTGFRGRFPWRGAFTGAQPNNGAANARAVAGAHFQITHEPITFVEQRDHRDPVGHRSGPCDPAALFGHCPGAGNFGFDFGNSLTAIGRAVAARQRQQQHCANPDRPACHPASGRQAS
jgi:hypothetical protein